MDKYTILAQKRDSTTKTKTSRTVAQSPGFEDQKEKFRIILANRISLPTFLLPQIQKFFHFFPCACLWECHSTTLSIYHQCAWHFTRNDSNIAYQQELHRTARHRTKAKTTENTWNTQLPEMDKHTIFGTKPGFYDEDKNIKNCGAITGIRRTKRNI